MQDFSTIRVQFRRRRFWRGRGFLAGAGVMSGCVIVGLAVSSCGGEGGIKGTLEWDGVDEVPLPWPMRGEVGDGGTDLFPIGGESGG